ncbi:hypothetical protein G9A89_020018 [Geosiphon pyriformis]|nr:hypothetical protein G9A89_020018 [Geosiphon pyriformis]
MPSPRLTSLKALTVLEPYGTCIIHGTKRIENRTYPLSIPTISNYNDNDNGYGLWLAIHAAASPRLLNPAEPTCQTIRLQYWSDLPPTVTLRENCGKILGVAKFVACLKAEEVSDEEIWKAPEDAYGGKQQYCWIIGEVRALNEPIKCPGQQRLWRVDEAVAQRIWHDVGL